MNLGSVRIVGTGSIGRRYARILTARGVERLLVVPVGGRLRDPWLAAVAEVEPLKKTNRPIVDLTIIASNTARHILDLNEQAPFSRFILVEKPVAPTYALGCLADIPDGMSGVTVSAPLRFTDGYAAVKSALSSLGPVNGVTITCHSWLPAWRPESDYRLSYSADPEEGGVLRDLVHEIDYALELFGSPIGLTCNLQNSSALEIHADANAQMTWQYPTFSLDMNLSFARRSESRSLEVRGQAGSLHWDLLRGTLRVVSSQSSHSAMQSFPTDLDRDYALLLQVTNLIHNASGRASCGFHSGLRAIALCDAARESNRQLRFIELAGPPWSSP